MNISKGTHNPQYIVYFKMYIQGITYILEEIR